MAANLVASAQPRQPPSFFRDGFRVDVTTFSTSTPIDGVPHTTTSTTSIVLTPQDYEPAKSTSRRSLPIPLVGKSTEFQLLVFHLPANPATGATRAHLTALLPTNRAMVLQEFVPLLVFPLLQPLMLQELNPLLFFIHPATPIHPTELAVAVRNQLTVAILIQVAVLKEAIPAEGEPLIAIEAIEAPLPYYTWSHIDGALVR